MDVNQTKASDELEPFVKFKGEINEMFAAAYVARDNHGRLFINYDMQNLDWQLLPPFMYEMLKNNLHQIKLFQDEKFLAPEDTLEKIDELIYSGNITKAWQICNSLKEDPIKEEVITILMDAQKKKEKEIHHSEIQDMQSVMENIYKKGEFSEFEDNGNTPPGSYDRVAVDYSGEKNKKHFKENGPTSVSELLLLGELDRALAKIIDGNLIEAQCLDSINNQRRKIQENYKAAINAESIDLEKRELSELKIYSEKLDNIEALVVKKIKTPKWKSDNRIDFKELEENKKQTRELGDFLGEIIEESKSERVSKDWLKDILGDTDNPTKKKGHRI